jgi:hypothetical protein
MQAPASWLPAAASTRSVAARDRKEDDADGAEHRNAAAAAAAPAVRLCVGHGMALAAAAAAAQAPPWPARHAAHQVRLFHAGCCIPPPGDGVRHPVLGRKLVLKVLDERAALPARLVSIEGPHGRVGVVAGW